METAIHKKNCVPACYRERNTKVVPSMKIEDVIHALRSPAKMQNVFNPETECAWILKGGIDDG